MITEETTTELRENVSTTQRGVKKEAKFFYGWYVVGACWIALFAQAGIAFYGFSPFFAPLEQEFGWTRAQISAGMSLANVIVGISGPLVGRWTDTFGPRMVMLSGTVVLGATVAAMGIMTDLWQYYVIFFVSSYGRAALSNIPTGAVIGNWFREKRGMAIGISVTGIGVGGLILAPFVSYLISLVGWRTATIILGMAIIVIAIPPISAFVKRTPAEIGLRPYGAADQEVPEDGTLGPLVALPGSEGLTFQQSIRTPSFWLISAGMFLTFLGTSSILLHAVPYFIDRGESPQAAATILALIAGVGAIGKFVLGYLGDKIPARFAMATCFTLQAASYSLLLLPQTPITVPAFVLLYGLGMGGVITLWTLIAAETFGVGNLGTIIGAVGLVPTFALAGGPVVAGYIYDSTKSYTVAFSLFLVAALLGAVIVAFAKPAIRGAKRAGHVTV